MAKAREIARALMGGDSETRAAAERRIEQLERERDEASRLAAAAIDLLPDKDRAEAIKILKDALAHKDEDAVFTDAWERPE